MHTATNGNLNVATRSGWRFDDSIAMEAEMKRSHIATFIIVSAFGCATSVSAVAPSPNTADPTVQGQADQKQPGSDATSSTKSSDQSSQSSDRSSQSSDRSSHSSRSNQTNAKEHPPTAAMDSAMPSEKATDANQPAGKHPPSRAMESALPDQQSQPATGSQ